MGPRNDAALLGRGLARNLLAGVRLALFLPVRALDFRVSVGQFIALASTCLALWLALGLVRQGFPGAVDFRALTAALAAIPLLLCACMAGARVFREARLGVAFAVVFAAGIPTFLTAGTALDLLSSLETFEPYARAADWVFVVWAFAAVVRGQVVLTGWRGGRSAFALALFVGLFAVLMELAPGGDLWIATGEGEADDGEPRLTQEEVFHLQGRLLDERLAALEPERSGVEDLYFVGVAADSGEDTFYSEVASIKELLDERFDTAGRSIVLINNPASLTEQPIATVSNLRATLAYLGNTIDTEEDIVFLHIATHGSSDYQLGFDLPPLELDQLTPSSLARMLADSGIKWKVIVISACFAGGFVEPLRDDNTLIITAADALHPSFGCSYDSDYTWFSEALYDEGLRETFSFPEAFDAAKKAVSERERAEGFPPSNPQFAMGSAMRGKLAALQKRLEAGYTPDPQRMRVIRVRTSDSRTVLVKGR
ncbi:MAG TPA: C13 family peptidase [Burkholderiales bacterium]|nr:C13 family peptidase [Burkholderiales bacterium]